MTPLTLQLALPDDPHLSPEKLAAITKRTTTRLQIAWLEANRWPYTLDCDKGILVGTLYAHLRLAGMHPVDMTAGAGPDAAVPGLNLEAVR